ncbi:hypothetical protein O181_064992 [Austropuccinia psidii MF-1]|uniref:glucan 1,4-alpha-glucosidase n=1 Tax=Austropuccinia psidii MF-1 TaxID=1389203 RepID=A0A9Q3ESP1_9BASI|nr:hypothetical protein [Austropuccinia psidii MF-1]
MFHSSLKGRHDHLQFKFLKILLLLKIWIAFYSSLVSSKSNTIPNEILSNQIDSSHNLNLDNWIHFQANKSWQAVLVNISPPSALPGLVVASLSTSKPDYFYSWTRDTAIVLKEIVYRYSETNDSNLLQIIKNSISSTQLIQKNSLHAPGNLGEPKYYVNGSAFNGPWGRPQRDGPALRATVYMNFAKAYLKSGGQEAQNYVNQILYDGIWQSRSVIKADLEYISNTWKENSFDLWEEVNGIHFFTLSVIQRALKDGAEFSHNLKDFGAANWYQKQAQEIDDQLKLFWDKKAGYLKTTIKSLDSHGKTSGLDVGTILACLHAGNSASSEFGLGSPKMVQTFQAILKSMAALYPLNSRYAHLNAKATGRYPEDIYDGVGTSIGNPWFLTTLAMSEFIYRSLNLNNKLNISENDSTKILDRKLADQFLIIIKSVANRNGSLHEQMDRVTGFGKGARDLTWSHVAFLSMYRARNGQKEF